MEGHCHPLCKMYFLIPFGGAYPLYCTMGCRLVTTLSTLCAFNQGVFAETLSATDDYVYEVKQGDNLGKLSGDVLDSPARWNEVARYNKLKNPNFIKPSQQLNIPLAWLKNTHAVAHIEFVTGAVLLNGQSARMGDAMSKDAVLETPAGGSVRLSLPDGSTINVLEKSNVAVKQLTKQQRGNFFNSIFRLVSGRIEVFKKKYSLGQAPLHIQGQNATIGVRGGPQGQARIIFRLCRSSSRNAHCAYQCCKVTHTFLHAATFKSGFQFCFRLCEYRSYSRCP